MWSEPCSCMATEWWGHFLPSVKALTPSPTVQQANNCHLASYWAGTAEGEDGPGKDDPTYTTPSVHWALPCWSSRAHPFPQKAQCLYRGFRKGVYKFLFFFSCLFSSFNPRTKGRRIGEQVFIRIPGYKVKGRKQLCPHSISEQDLAPGLVVC